MLDLILELAPLSLLLAFNLVYLCLKTPLLLLAVLIFLCKVLILILEH